MAQAQEIAQQYAKRGWTGQALEQRMKRHARLLDVLDADVAQACRRSVASHRSKPGRWAVAVKRR